MECQGPTKTGGPCQMAPLRDSAHCWIHDPSKAAERALARKRGGQRSRTGGTVIADLGAGMTPPTSISTMPAIQAGLDLVWCDTFAQPNSGQRSRTLVTVLLAAVKCNEVGELEARLAALEQTVNKQTGRAA
jgi:hypothetical protein